MGLTIKDAMKYPNARIREFNTLFVGGQYDYKNIVDLIEYKTKMDEDIDLSDCKLILRPLSLTEEEKTVLRKLLNWGDAVDYSYFVKYVLPDLMSISLPTLTALQMFDKLREWNIDIDGMERDGKAVYE